MARSHVATSVLAGEVTVTACDPVNILFFFERQKLITPINSVHHISILSFKNESIILEGLSGTV